jgi:predicted transporter
MCFAGFDTRKINTAFTITTASLFGSYAFIHHTTDVKNCSSKKNYYNYGLDIHVAKILHF